MDPHTPVCSRCGAEIPTPQDAVTLETLSEMFGLLWCSQACADADIADATWQTRLRNEEQTFRQLSREGGPLEIY